MLRDVSRSALGKGAFGFSGAVCEIRSPLLNRLEGRHLPIVMTEVDNPGPLVEPLLAVPGRPQILFGLLLAQPVHGHEMLEQLGPLAPVVDKQDMLGVVAVLAQAQEAAEKLIAGLFVVLPDLVAVETSLPAAYLAAVASPPIDGSADTVPPRWRKQSGQAGQPGAGRYGFDAQSQEGHVYV